VIINKHHNSKHSKFNYISWKITEFQKKAVKVINEIDSKYKRVHDNDTTLTHLIKEFEEIAREIYNGKIGRGKIDIKNLKEEFADVYMLLAKLADNFSINLEEAINQKINVLKKRHNLN